MLDASGSGKSIKNYHYKKETAAYNEDTDKYQYWRAGGTETQQNCTPFCPTTIYFLLRYGSVLFCSLAVLDPRVGHTMDVLSPFIPDLCRSD